MKNLQKIKIMLLNLGIDNKNIKMGLRFSNIPYHTLSLSFLCVFLEFLSCMRSRKKLICNFVFIWNVKFSVTHIVSFNSCYCFVLLYLSDKNTSKDSNIIWIQWRHSKMLNSSLGCFCFLDWLLGCFLNSFLLFLLWLLFFFALLLILLLFLLATFFFSLFLLSFFWFFSWFSFCSRFGTSCCCCLNKRKNK